MHLIQFPSVCKNGDTCRACRSTSKAAAAWRNDHGAPEVCPSNKPMGWQPVIAGLRPQPQAALKRPKRYQASEEEYAVRLPICQSCQFAPDGKCTLCKSCSNAPKIESVARNRSKCPAEKW